MLFRPKYSSALNILPPPNILPPQVFFRPEYSSAPKYSSAPDILAPRIFFRPQIFFRPKYSSAERILPPHIFFCPKSSSAPKYSPTPSILPPKIRLRSKSDSVPIFLLQSSSPSQMFFRFPNLLHPPSQNPPSSSGPPSAPVAAGHLVTALAPDLMRSWEFQSSGELVLVGDFTRSLKFQLEISVIWGLCWQLT